MGGAKAFVKKLLEYLEDGEYEIKFSWIDKETYGEINHSKAIIMINLPLLLVLRFVHEVLHDEYPDLDEQSIINKTDRMIKRMTKAEIILVATKLIESGIFLGLTNHNQNRD